MSVTSPEAKNDPMFIPSIEIVRVVQSGEAGWNECFPDGFLLMFALEDALRFRMGERDIRLHQHEVYLLSESSCGGIGLPDPGGAALAVHFTVQDDNLRTMVDRLGPKLHVDAIYARSCILNIRNADSLQADCIEDCIGYNILSLLYYGYIGIQKHRSPIASLNCGILFSPSSNETLNQILSYIDDHIASDISIRQLSAAFLQSPGQIDELFKCEYGCTTQQFISRFRLFKAKELMCYTNHSITEISSMTGFGSIHYFSRYFKEKEFISPTEYRRVFSRSVTESEL